MFYVMQENIYVCTLWNYSTNSMEIGAETTNEGTVYNVNKASAKRMPSECSTSARIRL